MNYRGVIIEESLTDLDIFKDVEIIETNVVPVSARHGTPWIREWTKRTVEVPEADIGAFTERLSKAIDAAHAGSWYADLKNDEYHYIVFSDKVFQVPVGHPEEYAEVVAYGLSLGIPREQLDFTRSES